MALVPTVHVCRVDGRVRLEEKDIVIVNENGQELERDPIFPDFNILVQDGQLVTAGHVLADWESSACPEEWIDNA